MIAYLAARCNGRSNTSICFRCNLLASVQQIALKADEVRLSYYFTVVRDGNNVELLRSSRLLSQASCGCFTAVDSVSQQ